MQCFDSLLPVGRCTAERPLITFAGSSSHNLSTMTSTCVLSSTIRPEPAAQDPRLQSACNESAAPLANVILMKSPAFRAATRCGADAMRRCDGDVTAMRPRRRRCNRAGTGAETAGDGAETGTEFKYNTDKIQTRYMYLQYKHDTVHTRIRYIHIQANICTF